ncbi:MAG TPA: GFA family protein [Oxalicibacterium sp.]|nr:GFA family protein [Oxalicibacterium sp.]
MRYEGSCHCGAVKFEAEGEIGAVIECNCSYCSRKGLLLWFVPRALMTLRAGAGQLTRYKFNKHRIDHQFCSVCGCQAFSYGTDPAGNEIAAINVRCVENVDLAALPRHAYDGRSA